MLKSSKNIIVLLAMCSTLNSCGYMAREIFASKRCERCEIFDENNNVVWSEDNCGGEVHNMTLKAKAQAYDYGCNHRLQCEKYKRVQ